MPESEADASTDSPSPSPSAPRMRRADRRQQILDAATRAFARTGFTPTSLDEVAREAGISRVILYRHFDSKADLYRKVLERVCNQLFAACGNSDYSRTTLPALIDVAKNDPDGFRLLFQHAAREPEFRDEMLQFNAAMTDTARAELTQQEIDPQWAQWAAQLSAVITVQAIIAWLDAGQPDPDNSANHIRHVLDAITETTRLDHRHPGVTN